MAFGTGTGAGPGDIPAGIVKGKQIKAACQCWCTSTGKVTPLMLKVQDEDGVIRTIREITVRSREKNRYAGIPSIEYDCTLAMGERSIRAWLIYYQTEGRWVLNFR